MKKNIFYIAITILLYGCLKDEPLKMEYKGFVPKLMNDGWDISTPENENINHDLLEEALQLFYSSERFPMANSLIVIRNGKIVAEAYCKDINDIDKLHNIQSCTKSITSILSGIALTKKMITSFETPLYNYYPELFDNDINKQKITIKNCLTMQGGLNFDNDIHTEELINTEENSFRYVLSKEMINDTGIVFHYNDGLPHLVGGVISKVSGKSLEEFAKENLFLPLGIKDYFWEKAKDSSNFGAFSLYLKPRDFAKIGQLCLQNGNWNGNQVFDTTWINSVTQIHTGQSSPYGYYFWILPSLNGYAMEGHGGQYLFVCPQKKLVVVYTAFSYTSPLLWDNALELIELIYRANE